MGPEELKQKLEEETALNYISICSKNPLNGILRLHLPPNNTKMNVVLFPSSSSKGAQHNSKQQLVKKDERVPGQTSVPVRRLDKCPYQSPFTCSNSFAFSHSRVSNLSTPGVPKCHNFQLKLLFCSFFAHALLFHSPDTINSYFGESNDSLYYDIELQHVQKLLPFLQKYSYLHTHIAFGQPSNACCGFNTLKRQSVETRELKSVL
ncbi:hypothetical protein DY000_02025761 [Brassica cretica]|nr:hypothetical protein DY000_02025761 [Brassica cretica]